MKIGRLGEEALNVPAPGDYYLRFERDEGQRAASGRLIKPADRSFKRRLSMKWHMIDQSDMARILSAARDEFYVELDDPLTDESERIYFYLFRAEMGNVGKSKGFITLSATEN
ncbi:MAG: hypothetical protein II920_04180 [Clostridia bacterium]|nr:hypothetical protein [Clostridia bacterium]